MKMEIELRSSPYLRKCNIAIYMNEELFVKQLESLTPTINELRRLGLSEDFNDAFIKSYKCNKRERAINHGNGFLKDPILSLLRNFDCDLGLLKLLSTTWPLIGPPRPSQVQSNQSPTQMGPGVASSAHLLFLKDTNITLTSFASQRRILDAPSSDV